MECKLGECTRSYSVLSVGMWLGDRVRVGGLWPGGGDFDLVR